MRPVALTIAGSDPSGGAGIQADLKTFHQFGVYGEAVITLLTVQNTRAVSAVETVRPEFVAQQISAVLADIPPGAVKTGALGTAAIVEAVAVALSDGPRIPLVVDPVMVSKHGSPLMDAAAEQALVKLLLPLATLLTPNVPEAEALAGMTIAGEQEMVEAARRIQAFGVCAVLIKGGHLTGNEAIDVLVDGDRVVRFPGRRIDTNHTHGTGCTYSAAIAAGLAAGNHLYDAIARAKGFLQAAIEGAPGLGRGLGPVNHFAPVEPRA